MVETVTKLKGLNVRRIKGEQVSRLEGSNVRRLKKVLKGFTKLYWFLHRFE